MEQLSTSLEGAEAPEISTQLDDGRPADPSQAKPQPDEGEEKAKQPESRLDATKRAAADLEKTEPKAEDKPEPKQEEPAEAKEPKVEPPAPAEAEQEEGKASVEDKPQTEQPTRHSNGDENPVKAPSYFSRESLQKWTNVPRVVQREIEQHAARAAQVTERYERLREFDEIASSNGRDLRESLAEVVRFENLMKANPIAGLNHALSVAGPRKADGQPVSLYEVAEFIVQQGPQGYQQTMAQANQRFQQQEQTQQQLAQREQQIRIEAETEALRKHVIDPFIASHPNYHEYETTIAYFLKHGNIDASLSPSQRLEEAYRLAESIHSSQARRSEPRLEPLAVRVDESSSDHRRADDNFSGTKSIRGAPATGVDTSSKRKRTMSRGDAISAAMQELGIA